MFSKLIDELKNINFPAYIVNDGSTDYSQQLIENSGFPFVQYTKNMGKGSALKAGMKWAFSHNYDAVITMDGDRQHPISVIPEFIELSKSVDLVIGNRINRPGKMPLSRRFSNWAVSSLVSIRSGEVIPDAQCGMRLIKRNLWENITIENSGYFSEIELLIKAILNGYSVGYCEIPTIYNTSRSTIRPLREIAIFIGGLLRSLAW